ncbi:MAG: hypothetical protein JWO98_2061 [Frankiales bacterium]|nr:hypothetical protein [Frankiales bacterium]
MTRRDVADPFPRSTVGERCPRCDSPAPNLHPAVQHEGEVTICPDPWHGPPRPGSHCPGCGSEMWPPIRHGVTAEGLPCHDPWHYPRPAGERVTVTGRRVHREERVDLVVTGAPEMQFRPPGGGARLSAVPTSARVNYRFVQGYGGEPDRWETTADVWCPGGYRQLVVDGDDHNVEHWPAWLVHHAEANHPDRPGGWPGDDPEGSYL